LNIQHGKASQRSDEGAGDLVANKKETAVKHKTAGNYRCEQHDEFAKQNSGCHLKMKSEGNKQPIMTGPKYHCSCRR